MKARHRHELKTNELAQWLANFPQWAKKNLMTIIYVSALIAVVAGLYIWRSYSRNVISVQKQLRFTTLLSRLLQSKSEILRARAQGIDISYILLRPANSLETFARDTKDDTVAALALIERAEALRAELHYRQGSVSKRDLTTQINLAKSSYNEALSRLARLRARGKSNPSLIALAEFGLGLCEEDLGNFDQAKQIYQDLVANPDFEATTTAVQAKLRLDTMADYRKKVVFSPPKKPTPTKSIQPQIQLKPVDINLAPLTPKIQIKPVDLNLPGQ
jgi:tetratricopeptide (TPR) repeat protein